MMIVSEEELSKYLGKRLDDLEGKVSFIILRKLRQYQEGMANLNLSVIDYLFIEHHKNNKSLNQLRKELNISIHTLSKIFDVYNLPMLDIKESTKRAISELWKNPAYRVYKIKQIKEFRGTKEAREKYSEFSKNLWLDPKMREKMVIGLRKSMKIKGQEPELREKRSKKQLELWSNPEYREKQTKLIIDSMGKVWQNPEFREKKSKQAKEWSSRLWQTEEYRSKMSEVGRRVLTNSWGDPNFRNKMLHKLLTQNYLSLHTVYGYRGDLGFPTWSTWEANLARILIYCGRLFESRKILELKVDEKYENIFQGKKIDVIIDFLVVDNRENIYLYEILVKSFKKQEGMAKLEMILEQYPNLDLRIINQSYYERLERWFKDKINSDSRFIGWETYKDNLKTNPEKYSKSK